MRISAIIKQQVTFKYCHDSFTLFAHLHSISNGPPASAAAKIAIQS